MKGIVAVAIAALLAVSFNADAQRYGGGFRPSFRPTPSYRPSYRPTTIPRYRAPTSSATGKSATSPRRSVTPARPYPNRNYLRDTPNYSTNHSYIWLIWWVALSNSGRAAAGPPNTADIKSLDCRGLVRTINSDGKIDKDEVAVVRLWNRATGKRLTDCYKKNP